MSEGQTDPLQYRGRRRDHWPADRERTVWLSQREIAELFDRDVRAVNQHIRNVITDWECDPRATIRKYRIVQTEGWRQPEREVDTCNLDVILSLDNRDTRGRRAGGTCPARPKARRRDVP